MFPWISFLSYAAVTAITPGPNNIISLSNGLRVGFRKGIPYNLGQVCAYLLLLPGCILLCNLFSPVLGRVLPAMKIAGAVYLLYLAWKSWRAPTDIQAGEGKTGFRQGVLMQLVNPKLYLYVLVPAETMIVPAYGDRWYILALFGVGMSLYGFLCSLGWLGFGGVLCRVYRRFGRGINLLVALALVYCAVSLFL